MGPSIRKPRKNPRNKLPLIFKYAILRGIYGVLRQEASPVFALQTIAYLQVCNLAKTYGALRNEATPVLARQTTAYLQVLNLAKTYGALRQQTSPVFAGQTTTYLQLCCLWFAAFSNFTFGWFNSHTILLGTESKALNN